MSVVKALNYTYSSVEPVWTLLSEKVKLILRKAQAYFILILSIWYRLVWSRQTD